MSDIKKLKARIDYLEKQIKHCIDFSLGFALCNTEHMATRRDVKKAQDFLRDLLKDGDHE